MIKQIARYLAIHIFDILFLILSLYIIFIAGISFLGGPEGKLGSPASIIGGFVFLFLGLLALRGSLRLLRKNNHKESRNEKVS